MYTRHYFKFGWTIKEWFIIRSKKLSESVTGEVYREHFIRLKGAFNEKREEWKDRRSQVILLQKTLNALGWDIIPHPPYSSDIAPSDYYLFRLLAHELSEQFFRSSEVVEKCVDE